MPPRSDITYFGAGPALLPSEVLEDAAKALINYGETGLGHRALSLVATDLASCLDILDYYEICFMQGGGPGYINPAWVL